MRREKFSFSLTNCCSIFRSIRDKNISAEGDDKPKGRVNVNSACQIRVSNTEKMRRALWKSHDFRYDDDNPPEQLPGDKRREGGFSQQNADDDSDDDVEEVDQASGDWIMKKSTKKLTCPHYRQLTSARTAQMARANFLVTQDKIDCCGSGGDKTSLGVHDIEDLVKFGVDPYLQENVALYRPNGQGSFGIDVGNDGKISLVKKDSAAESNGQIKKGDKIVGVNGRKVYTLKQITEAISTTTKDPLELTLLKKKASATSENPAMSVPDKKPLTEERNVAICRAKNETGFGIVLEGHTSVGQGCLVNELKLGGAAARGGQVKVGDSIVRVNGISVAYLPFDRVVSEIKKTKQDPLRLRIRREIVSQEDIQDSDGQGEDLYSAHSACPYYLSRALSKYSELIFAPYNYVLDPGIRSALDIDLKGAIVVLDEAHNVEGTLTESGSIKVGEIELTKLLAMLSHQSQGLKSRNNTVETVEGDQKDITEVAHELLLFVEKILMYMRELRSSFERSTGKFCGLNLHCFYSMQLFSFSQIPSLIEYIAR